MKDNEIKAAIVHVVNRKYQKGEGEDAEGNGGTGNEKPCPSRCASWEICLEST